MTGVLWQASFHSAHFAMKCALPGCRLRGCFHAMNDDTSTSTPPEAVPAEPPAPPSLKDDLGLDDTPLGERQADACSMEEGCERCQ